MLKCSCCDKEFANYRQLNGHMIVHKNGPRYSVSRKSEVRTFACKQCGEIKPHRKGNYDLFCSLQCQADYRWIHEVKPRIIKGEVHTSRVLRRYLTETHGYHCSECSISEWNGKLICLHVDHRDGNSDNNLPDNLRLICPNCHSQTETWCGRNIEKGKPKQTRRSRYMRSFGAPAPI
jgi:hypothetical protein